MKYQDEYIALTNQIKEICKKIREGAVIHSSDKGTYDEVTNLDVNIEKELIGLIHSFDSSANIISEELNSAVKLDGKTWIIDPIDGTCNFTHGIKIYGIQCALYEDDVGMFSLIYFPETNELFTAIKGEGAKLNGRAIHPASRPPQRSIISFGDFVHSNPELVSLEHHIMKKVAPNVEKLRMFGAASVDFAYAACGRIDGNFTFINNPWDILPGVLLCKEAGLYITDAFGNPYDLSKKTVAVFSTEELYHVCF